MNIKSPLRYPGGKSKVVKYIVEHIKKDFEEFREPFVGGGSVFFYLKQKYPNKKFWINDIYENLFLFYKMMRDYPNEVIEKILYFKENFNDGKELYEFLVSNEENFNDIEKAASFFVLNRITFSGTTLSGGYSKQAFEKRFTNSSIERLKKIIPLLKNVNITNYDYTDLLLYEGQNVFIFLDPPYYKAQKSALYGKNGNLHKGFDYIKLADSLKKTSHFWLMTIDNSEYIKELFSFAYIKEWNITYGMRNVGKNINQKETELLISNYNLNEKNLF